MRFISHRSYEITHLLVAPVTAFAGQLCLSAGFSPQVQGTEWQRGTLDTVKVHRHAAHARCPSFAARPCLSTCFTSVNAFFCSPALFSAVSTRSRSGPVSVRWCVDAGEVLPRVVASGLIVPTAVQNSNQWHWRPSFRWVHLQVAQACPEKSISPAQFRRELTSYLHSSLCGTRWGRTLCQLGKRGAKHAGRVLTRDRAPRLGFNIY
jgi:hypothetical protein